MVTDRDDKERFKARIEKFWLDTADINVKDQLNRALASRYRRSRALRVRFLQLFWIICAIVAFIAGLENASQNPGNFLGILQLDFGTRYAIQCGYILIRDNRTEAADYCDSTKNPTGPPELEHLREEKQNYENFVTKLSDYPGALFAAGFFSEVLIVLFIAVPLSFALWISFHVTLRLLSKITGSRIYYALLVALDLAIAIATPPILASALSLVFLGGSILFFGQGLDFFTFPSPSWLTLTVGAALFSVTLSYLFPALVFVLAVTLPGSWGVIVAAALFTLSPLLMAYVRVHAIASDVTSFFGLEVSSIDSCIDWAIFVDVVFSMTYLAPSFALVLANRSDRSRKTFMNLAMWIHDHNRGPFVALSELSGMFLQLFKR